MKQAILTFVTICIAFIGNICIGQVVTLTGTNCNVDTNVIHNIVQHNASTGNVPASPQASAGQRIIWLEYGDGSFTTNPISTHTLRQNTNWLLVSNRLYDTTVEKKMYAASFPSTTALTPLPSSPDNANSLLTGNHPSVVITPNVYDIVKKDTMNFAISYKLPVFDKGIEGIQYYLIFMYDSTVFENFSNNPQLSIDGITVNFIRKYHNETIVSNSAPPGLLSQNVTNGYNRFVVIKITESNILERNLFITLLTKSLLPATGSTSVKAILVLKPLNQNFSSVDEYPITGMNFKTSHDPNYITQYPVCMQLPKIARTFSYHIHFQNTGEGEADSVKITAFLPRGLILNNQSIRLGNNNFASDPSMIFSHSFNTATGTIIFGLKKDRGTDLKGTYGIPNPLVNTVTMGDIYFDVQSTANTPLIMDAKASIEFHSSEPARLGGRWELPVNTNVARSYYSNCTDSVYCNCIIPTVDSTIIKPVHAGDGVDSCAKILRICWWWWIIVAAGLIIIYVLVRKRKK